MLFVSLHFASAWEQSQSPGEKNMGVAVLGIMFGVPMLLAAAAGLVSLVVSGIAFVWLRIVRRVWVDRAD